MFAKIVVLLALASVMVRSGWTGEILVPEDYSAIWQAVDAAAEGDTVSIGPGTWSETDLRQFSNGALEAAMFLKPGVVVLGRNGAESTAISVSSTSARSVAVAMFDTGNGAPAVVQGLTLSSVNEGVAAFDGAPIHLVSCTIQNCGDSGVSVRNTDLTLVDCRVYNCDTRFPGSGAAVAIDQCEMVVQNTCFEQNNDHAIRLVAIADVPSLRVEGARFLDNRATAVEVGAASIVELSDCIFVGNLGGGALLFNTDGEVTNCVFADQERPSGAGIVSQFGDVLIANNTFYRCVGTESAAAIVVASGSAPIRLRGNVFAECASPIGVVMGFGSSDPESGCNLFFSNDAPIRYEQDLSEFQTDLVGLDPQFCDAASLDFTLRASSPAAPENSGGCGLIGALGVSCEPISTRSQTWSSIKSAHR